MCAPKDCSSRKASKPSAPQRGSSMLLCLPPRVSVAVLLGGQVGRALVRFANPLASGFELPQVCGGARIDEHWYPVIECFPLLISDNIKIILASNLRSLWVSRRQTAALLALSYSVSYDQRFTSPKSNTRNRVHIALCISHYKS